MALSTLIPKFRYVASFRNWNASMSRLGQILQFLTTVKV